METRRDPANCFAMLTRVTYHGSEPPAPLTGQAAHTERLHRGVSVAAEAPPPKMDRQSECSICLDKFEARQVLRRVGCGHVFRDKCAKMWFNGHHTRCPICRYDMMLKGWSKAA